MGSELRRDQELAARARPLILEQLRSGREPLQVSSQVAGRFGVDETKAYRWVAYISEDFERRRRRIAVVGLTLLWLGVLAAVAGAVVWLFGVRAPGIPYWVLGVVIGLPVAGAGLIVSLASRRLVRDSV